MPMCYLYHNAVELNLKRLIIEDINLSKQDAIKILNKKKHSILGLWNSIEFEIEFYIKTYKRIYPINKKT